MSAWRRYDCDVVVVGSGAGGAVVAKTLAEAGQSVIVVEEGPQVTPDEHGPMRPSESMRHVWRDGGTTFAMGVGDTPMINVTMGRCVGGSSALTGGVCFRTPGHVLDEWVQDHGLVELSERGMDAAFQAVEEAVHVEQVPKSMWGRSTLKFAEGAARLGKPVKPMLRNTKGCRGCGTCNFGCPQKAKLSVDISYLPQAIAAGAQLLSEVRVDKIQHKNGRATGIRGVALDVFRKPIAKIEIKAKRVVVSAGSYGSPALLKRSGVGEGSDALGGNLALHPAFRMMAEFNEPIQGWKGSLQAAYSDAYESERLTLTDLFIPPGVIAGMMKGVGPEYIDAAQKVPNLAVFGGLIHDFGGGRVHHLLGRTFATYRMAKADRALVPRLLRVMAETFFAAGAKNVFFPVLGLGPVDADRYRSLDLEHVPAHKFECASQHPLGTCRMSTTAAAGVVDQDAQSFELAELFVIDGSILPTSLGVNPQLSIMALATYLAWKLRDRPLPR